MKFKIDRTWIDFLGYLFRTTIKWSLILIVFLAVSSLFFSCEKNPIVENYYTDIVPFEVACIAYWEIEYREDGLPYANVMLNAVVTQRIPGEYEDVWIHARLSNGDTLEEIGQDSSQLSFGDIPVFLFNEVGQYGTANFAFYKQKTQDYFPQYFFWAMWVTFTTIEGIEKSIEIKDLEVRRIN